MLQANAELGGLLVHGQHRILGDGGEVGIDPNRRGVPDRQPPLPETHQGCEQYVDLAKYMIAPVLKPYLIVEFTALAGLQPGALVRRIGVATRGKVIKQLHGHGALKIVQKP